MTKFATRLKELRVIRGKTQRQMAMYLGIIDSAYQRYEYGGREPNFDTVIKIADYLSVTTDYLLGRTDYWLDAEGKRQPNEQDKSTSES